MGRWSHELMGLCTEVLRLLKVLRLLNASVLQWYLLVSLPRPTMITEPAADCVLSGLSGVVRRLFRKVRKTQNATHPPRHSASGRADRELIHKAQGQII